MILPRRRDPRWPSTVVLKARHLQPGMAAVAWVWEKTDDERKGRRGHWEIAHLISDVMHDRGRMALSYADGLHRDHSLGKEEEVRVTW